MSKKNKDGNNSRSPRDRLEDISDKSIILNSIVKRKILELAKRIEETNKNHTDISDER